MSPAEFIAGFEGFEAAPYLCPAGKWTIGFGTTRYPDGAAVTGEDPACTREQALAWLARDVADAEAAVARLVKVPLTEGQRTAVVSLLYNIGEGAFAGSTLLRLLNRRLVGDAGREFPRWNRGGGKVLPGLVRRRAAEQALFMGGD